MILQKETPYFFNPSPHTTLIPITYTVVVVAVVVLVGVVVASDWVLAAVVAMSLKLQKRFV